LSLPAFEIHIERVSSSAAFPGAAGREMAAYLCRQWTRVSLKKLSAVFGLEHPDSSSNLVRRAKRRAEESLEYQKITTLLETKLGLKTENQV